MRFAFVMERDPKFQKDLCDVLLKIEPELQVRIFDTLESFVAWIKIMMQTGQKAFAQAGQSPPDIPQTAISETDAHELALIIAPVEFFGARQLGLIKKTKATLIKRNLCPTEDPTAFVLTAFEDPDFDLKSYQDKDIHNVIFKPFDKLILAQHLTFALDGRHPPSSYALTNQKFSSVIEMLKGVPCEGLSEVGFLTRSVREIPLGMLSKYYGIPFVAERQKSMMAKVGACIPHPEKPGEYLVSLQFFAADPTQISQIRRRITNQAELYPYDWKTTRKQDSGAPLHFLFIDPDFSNSDSLSDGLKRKFKNIESTIYEDLTDVLLELDPKSVPSTGQPPKPFQPGTELELVFDLAGRVIYQTPCTEFLTQKPEDFLNKTSHFTQLLEPEQQALWRQWILNPGPELRLKLKNKSGTFYLKTTGFQKSEKQISIKFAEMSAGEKNDFMSAHSKFPKRVDALIIGHQFFHGSSAEKWVQLKEMVQRKTGQSSAPKLFMVAAKAFSDTEEREHSVYLDDIFFKPVDRSYFLKKIKLFLPELIETEGLVAFPTLKWSENFKSANPVKISEISEAGLILAYNRSLEVGEFREFVLWKPYEIEAPELWAQTNFVEENQATKGEYSCHFVFFGVMDRVLKQIRLWLRDSYILSKEQSG